MGLPNENLCPPIPGRADYLHYIMTYLRNLMVEKSHWEVI
ncbi:MAG: RlmF-related methyltransferase [Saprospiraceae bacterium]